MGTLKLNIFSLSFVVVFAFTKGLEVSHDAGREVKAPLNISQEDSTLVNEVELASSTNNTGLSGTTTTLDIDVNTSLAPVDNDNSKYENNSSTISGETAVNAKKPSVIQETVNLLKQGDVKILLDDDIRDVVLILGNTGAGKSSFTQWISKDDSGLVAVDTAEDTGEFIIVDNNNRIGDSTIKSKTIFPELVTDPNNKHTYYDFPGFSDTRSTSNDITTSYFIKKVVDHVERIKIVFVMSYPSVRKGVDRQDFMEVVKHITELIKDIEKYRHGIALVVTKVDNQYQKQKGKFTLISDETIIKRIYFFLQEVKNNLIKESKLLNFNSKQHLFFENAVKLIDILLNDDGLPKIALFRRPDESGPIDSNSLLIDGKSNTRKLITNDLIFVSKNNEDFGYTISDKSKNDIIIIAEEIHRNVLTIVRTISEEIKTDLESLIKQADLATNSFNISDTDSIDYVFSLVEYLNEKLTREYDSLLKLVQDIKTTKDVEELAKIIASTTKVLNIQIINENVARLLEQARYFNFILKVSDREFTLDTNSLAWASIFQSVVTDLSNQKARIQNNTNYITTEIDAKIKFNMFEEFESLQHTISDEEMLGTNLKQIVENLKRTRQNLTNIQDNTDPLSVFKLLENMNIQLTNHTKVNIKNHKKYYELLQHEIGKMIEFVENSLKWNNFTIFLFDKLSEYEIQKDTSKCANSSLNIFGTDTPRQVQDTNLCKFMDECFEEDYKQEYNAVRFVKLDPSKTKQLTRALQQTLLQHPEHTCQWYGKLTVKGPYIKLSDVLSNDCGRSSSIIEIYALDKVFIDRSLDKTAQILQFSIMAPTWEIIGNQTINLDGNDGEPHWKAKADDGDYKGSDGNDGMPGRRGSPGGNFFGVVETLINSRGLTISANGGNGGRGQDGGDGGDGIDGSSPNIPDQHDEFMPGWKYSDFSYRTSHLNKKETIKYDGVFKEQKDIEFLGEKCTDGGNAGAGGYGGAGGIEGKVVIYGSSNVTGIKISRKRGETGPHGSSGSPGKPGHSGQNILYYVERRKAILVREYGYIFSRHYLTCEAGQHKVALNLVGMEAPQHLPDNQEMFVHDYEMYATQNINHTLTRHSLLDFYKYIVEKISLEHIHESLPNNAT